MPRTKLRTKKPLKELYVDDSFTEGKAPHLARFHAQTLFACGSRLHGLRQFSKESSSQAHFMSHAQCSWLDRTHFSSSAQHTVSALSSAREWPLQSATRSSVWPSCRTEFDYILRWAEVQEDIVQRNGPTVTLFVAQWLNCILKEIAVRQKWKCLAYARWMEIISRLRIQKMHQTNTSVSWDLDPHARQNFASVTRC